MTEVAGHKNIQYIRGNNAQKEDTILTGKIL
jgi:hypothetical protein